MDVKGAAKAAGFEIAGIASLGEPFAGHPNYLRWLEHGHHAGMEYLARHAEARRSAESILTGAKSALVVGKFYSQPRPPGAKVARYAVGRDYHSVLRSRLRRIGRSLASENPDARFRVAVDSAPVLERELAQRAGLGWFGKNTMLIDSRRGSYFLIAALLTTLEWEPDLPAQGGCGTCRACIDACPTGALVHADGRWQVDGRRCISYWTIEHKGPEPPPIPLDGWVFGCDVCQEVCPFNHPRPHQPERAATTTDQDFVPRDPRTAGELAEFSVTDWDQWTRGRAVRRSGHEALRRNARLAADEGVP